MSAYISVYIRANKSSPWIWLTSYSRSSEMYGLFKDKVPYEQYVPLTDAMLATAKVEAESMIERLRKSIQEYQSTIDFLAQLYSKNSNDLEEILTRRYDELELIEDCENQIKDLQYIIAEIVQYQDFVENQNMDDSSEVEYVIAKDCSPD